MKLDASDLKFEIYKGLGAELEAKKARRVTQTGYSLLLHSGILAMLYYINTIKYEQAANSEATLKPFLPWLNGYLLVSGIILALTWIYRQRKFYYDKNVTNWKLEKYKECLTSDLKMNCTALESYFKKSWSLSNACEYAPPVLLIVFYIIAFIILMYKLISSMNGLN